jgi:hypothetical protein
LMAHCDSSPPSKTTADSSSSSSSSFSSPNPEVSRWANIFSIGYKGITSCSLYLLYPILWVLHSIRTYYNQPQSRENKHSSV